MANLPGVCEIGSRLDVDGEGAFGEGVCLRISELTVFLAYLYGSSLKGNGGAAAVSTFNVGRALEDCWSRRVDGDGTGYGNLLVGRDENSTGGEVVIQYCGKIAESICWGPGEDVGPDYLDSK